MLECEAEEALESKEKHPSDEKLRVPVVATKRERHSGTLSSSEDNDKVTAKNRRNVDGNGRQEADLSLTRATIERPKSDRPKSDKGRPLLRRLTGQLC